MVFLNSKITRNATWIIGCKIVQALLGIVISAFSARYLGPSNYGIINYASAIVAFVVPIMQLGINDVLVNEMVSNPNDTGKIIGSSLVLCSISAVLSMGGIFSFVLFSSQDSPETLLVVSLYSISLIFQALELVVFWFQANYLSKYTSLISFFAYLLVSGYKLFLLISQKSIIWFAVSNSVDYAIIAIAQLVFYRKLGGQKIEFSRTIAKKLLSASKYYIIPNLMIAIFANTDRIMIKSMLGEEQTGLYSAAVSCVGFSSFFFAAIINSFRPDIFESLSKGTILFEKKMMKLYRIIIFFSLIQSVFTCICSLFVIRILCGPLYFEAVPALRIIVWYTTFSYLGAAVGIWILANGQQRWLLPMNFIGAFSNIVLNLILIPKMGIEGAALASLITQIISNVCLGLIIKPLRKGYVLMFRSLRWKEWREDIRELCKK